MSDWKPGTVAIATVRGVPNVRVARMEDAVFDWLSLSLVDGACWHAAKDLDDVRPLVTLDLDLAAHIGVDQLVADLRSGGFYDLADQIEAQIRPPKPAEPGGGLGAQVRDRDGETWVRNSEGAWLNLHGSYGLDPALSWNTLCEKYGPIEVQP